MHDVNSSWSTSATGSLEPTYNSASSTEMIQDVAMRPILIYSFAWDVSREVAETFDPWTLFFTNKRVINRIANFKLLRTNLKLTFQINGNPFYYGRMLASYVPLPTVDVYSVSREGVIQDRIEESQRMHLYLDPTTSTGGEMSLPFLYPKNAIEITRGEWNRLGRVTLSTLSPLLHANKSSQPVTISVWASADGVDVDQLTSLNPLEIEAQSGEGDKSELPRKSGDEYFDGPISKPASALAKMAGMLAKAPVIGPYARATEIGASAIGNVAKIFGYSKPRVITQSHFVNTTSNAHAQNIDGESISETLALTLKQETTIDPRTMNAPKEDEMSLIHLAQKECFLTKFEWKETDPPQKLLFNVQVSPTLYDTYNVANPIEVHMTPMCWVSTPFEFWRGSIEFRFQVVCSKYHKGRIRLLYDPNYQASNEYNVNRQIVVDLDSSCDFSMKVGWGQSKPYLPITHIDDGVIPFSTAPIGAAVDNGILSVFVVNELTTPSDDPNDVEVLVFAKACEDFSVNVPYQDTIERSTILTTFPDLGPGWRSLTIPGIFIHNANLTPGQTIGDALTVWKTDAAINGVPDYDGDADFVIPVWNQALLPDRVEITIRMGYKNTTNVSTTIDWVNATSTVNIDMDANTTEEDIIVKLNPIVPTGFSELQYSLQVPNWVNDDVMELVIYDYSISVPGNIDYIVYEPGSSLVTGANVIPHPQAEFPNGSPVDVWDLSLGEEIFISPPPSTEFAPLTPVIFLKPEGEPNLSSNLGNIVASPTGTGFNLVKQPVLVQSGTGEMNVANISGTSSLAGILAFTQDLEAQSGEGDKSELPTSAQPTSDSYDFTAGKIMSPGDAASLIHFGEEPVSWRSCLKRMQTVCTMKPSLPRYRLERPVLPNFDSQLADAENFTTLFHWVVPAYVCWKGALRYRVDDGRIPFSGDISDPPPLVNIWRHEPYDGSENLVSIVGGFVDQPFIWGGGAYQQYNEVRMMEIPWYNNYRFQYGRGLLTVNSSETSHYTREFTLWGSHRNEFSSIVISQAAGEDFTLNFFLSTPVVSVSQPI